MEKHVDGLKSPTLNVWATLNSTLNAYTTFNCPHSTCKHPNLPFWTSASPLITCLELCNIAILLDKSTYNCLLYKLPPANEVWGKVIFFTHVCQSVHSGWCGVGFPASITGDMTRGGGGLHQGARKVGGTHHFGMLPCLLVIMSNPRETSFIRSTCSVGGAPGRKPWWCDCWHSLSKRNQLKWIQ